MIIEFNMTACTYESYYDNKFTKIALPGSGLVTDKVHKKLIC